MNTLLIGYLAAVDPLLYEELTLEDKIVEDATAILFLLSGILLFGTAAAERKLALRCVYVLGGALMVFVTGEEISWGQRIFGFATPDFLASVNYQNEFNVHNIDFHGLYKIQENGTLALCVLTCAALFSGKDSLFRIPLPSILLVLSFILVTVSAIPNQGFSIFQGEILLLTLLLAYALFSEQYKLFIVSAVAAAIIFANSYIDQLGAQWYRAYEMREYLLSICCLFYSLEILLDQEAAKRDLRDLRKILDNIRSSVRPSWLPHRIDRAPEANSADGFTLSLFLALSSLLIFASIGLALLQYDINKSDRNRFESTYQSLISGEPEARSNFDIYLEENQLIYIKQPCILSDTENRFFLHLIPVHEEDLLRSRKHHGFNKIVHRKSMTFDDVCIAMVELPGYAIDRIRTGQFNTDGQIWRVEFPFPQ